MTIKFGKDSRLSCTIVLVLFLHVYDVYHFHLSLELNEDSLKFNGVLFSLLCQ